MRISTLAPLLLGESVMSRETTIESSASKNGPGSTVTSSNAAQSSAKKPRTASPPRYVPAMGF